MKTPFRFFSALLLLSPMVGYSKPDNWFGGADVDYWNEGKRVHDILEDVSSPADVSRPVTDSLIRSGDFQPFNWKNYESPSTPEFWDDGGNYVPPRPFRILAANPNEENLANYKAWVRRKLAVATHVGSLLGADMGDRETTQPRRSGQETGIRTAATSISRRTSTDWSKVTITFIYRTGCPFCAKEAPVMESLRKKGARVKAYQIEPRSGPPIFRPSTALSVADMKRFQINVTPTLILEANGKHLRIEGFEDELQLAEELKAIL